MSEKIDFGIYNGLEWEKLSTEYLHGLTDMGHKKASEELEKIYNSPIENQLVGFGKFAQHKWISLDVDYLYWILENVDMHNIKYILAKKALEYIIKYNQEEQFNDVIYVD